MSNSLAIAAVTATLRKILDDGIRLELPGSTVTTQPPDKVTTPNNQINLFLYHTMISAAWRNTDMPRQVKPGETGQPPLALNLFYLLTAYGQGDDSPDPLSHRLLGRAMSILHDHPVLSSDDIKSALPVADQTLYDLYDQVEHVRITFQPLTLDEMSKLWTTFQAKYRISTAYQASVVLIESNRPSRTPLPVLKRGPEDQGVAAQADLSSPFPTLTEIALPEVKKQQPSALLGDTLLLRGYHLDGDSLTVRFSNQRLNDPIEIGPLPAITTSGATEIALPLPDNLTSRAAWVAGYYTASLVVTRTSDPVNQNRTTNEIAFALAPHILPPLSPLTVPAVGGDFTLTVACSPEVRPEQRASLLFGANEIEADAHPAQTATLTFRIPVTANSVGEHFVRLRVDGVDSLLVKYEETPLNFDNDLKVSIT
jgi:hypothetical protein